MKKSILIAVFIFLVGTIYADVKITIKPGMLLYGDSLGISTKIGTKFVEFKSPKIHNMMLGADFVFAYSSVDNSIKRDIGFGADFGWLFYLGRSKISLVPHINIGAINSAYFSSLEVNELELSEWGFWMEPAIILQTLVGDVFGIGFEFGYDIIIGETTMYLPTISLELAFYFDTTPLDNVIIR